MKSVQLRHKFLLMSTVALSAFSQPGWADEQGLEEVVVTAERHSENIQKVPTAITAVTDEELEKKGINSGAEIADLVPGLKIYTQGPVTSLYIRGVGNSNSNPYADPDVTFNLDGVALSLPDGPNALFYDVARVEVLKGPQGTLYGRNATSGAVNVITNDPTDKYQGSAELTGGNYALFQGKAMLNVPIDDSLQIRGAMQAVRHDGYLSDGKDDADDIAGRFKARWTPTEDIDLRFGMDYAHMGGKGPGSVPRDTAGDYLAGGNPWTTQALYANNGGAPPFAAYAHQISGGQVRIDNPDAYVNNSNFGVWAQLDWRLGFGTLTVLPSYRNMKQDWDASDFGFGFRQYINDKSTSFEARLASDESAPDWLKWVGGVYALQEDLPNYIDVQQSFVPVGSSFPQGLQNTVTTSDHTQSMAAFGQSTVSVLPWLRVTGGVRYTHDHKTEQGYTYNFLPTLANPTANGTYDTDYAISTNHVTWRAGIDADVGPQSIVYGNVSTGYKAGGFGSAPDASALIPAPTLATYKPETILAYDVGTKNELFDRRLLINAEAFYWIYLNQQVNSISIDPVTTGINAIVAGAENAGHGDDEGLDLDLAYLLTPNDKITLSAEYLFTNYKSFRYAFLFFYNDNANKPFIDAPRWSGNLGYSHSWDLSSGAALTASVDTHLSTGYWLNYSYSPGSEYQGGFSKTGASLAYIAPDGKWHASLWVKNIENYAVKTYAGTAIPGGPNGPDGSGIQWTDLEPPRTFGVTIGADF